MKRRLSLTAAKVKIAEEIRRRSRRRRDQKKKKKKILDESTSSPSKFFPSHQRVVDFLGPSPPCISQRKATARSDRVRSGGSRTKSTGCLPPHSVAYAAAAAAAAAGVSGRRRSGSGVTAAPAHVPRACSEEGYWMRGQYWAVMGPMWAPMSCGAPGTWMGTETPGEIRPANRTEEKIIYGFNFY